MRLTMATLRQLVRESVHDCWGGSHPTETYDQELTEDDEAYQKHSVMVPDDVKASINKWAKAMGLSGRKKPKNTAT